MKRVVIIGVGAHAFEIAEILKSRTTQGDQIELLGFVNNDQQLSQTMINKVPVLGDWRWFDDVNAGEISVIAASGFSENRKRIVDRAAGLGLSFANAISPHAYISPDASIGAGVVIYPHVTVCRGATIGDHVIVNSGSIISHDTRLGILSTVNPGVSLAGNVSIGEGCYIGLGCSVIQGITIGSWTTVGAGAAVIADLGADVTAVGVPAQIIKQREKGWHEQGTSAAGS